MGQARPATDLASQTDRGSGDGGVAAACGALSAAGSSDGGRGEAPEGSDVDGMGEAD